MLRFSSSVASHRLMLASRATPGIPTATTTHPALLPHQQSPRDEAYKFGKSPVLESADDEEKDTRENQEPSTQEETLTLSTSDPTGFMQCELTVLTQYGKPASNQRGVTAATRPETSDNNQISSNDSGSDTIILDQHCVTPESHSETSDSSPHSTSCKREKLSDVAQEIRPVTGV